MILQYSLLLPPLFKRLLQKSLVVRKIVGVINLSEKWVTVTKLPFLNKYVQC